MGVINGLAKNMVIEYADRLEKLPHDDYEVKDSELWHNHFGLNTPLMYTYLYGGVLQDNMLPKILSKRKVDFDSSIIWAVIGGVPEITLEVSRLPQTSGDMKRIGSLNLYYKYEDKKLTIGTFVGYEDRVEQKARKISVKFE